MRPRRADRQHYRGLPATQATGSPRSADTKPLTARHRETSRGIAVATCQGLPYLRVLGGSRARVLLHDRGPAYSPRMPLPIPAPRADGTTTSTSAPLYWAAYGDDDAPTAVVV